MRKIIDTNHSIERFYDKNRFVINNEFVFHQEIERVIRDAIHVILTRYGDTSNHYGVHSKSTGIGVVIDWRPDRLGKDDNNHAIIMTILPIKKFHYFRPEDKTIIVEELMKNWFQLRATPRLSESAVDIEKEGDFSVTFFEGELYDYTILPYNFIIVD